MTPAARHGASNGLPSMERCSLARQRLLCLLDHPDPSLPSSPALLLCASRSVSSSCCNWGRLSLKHLAPLCCPGELELVCLQLPVQGQQRAGMSAPTTPLCARSHSSGETQSSRWDTPSLSVGTSRTTRATCSLPRLLNLCTAGDLASCFMGRVTTLSAWVSFLPHCSTPEFSIFLPLYF